MLVPPQNSLYRFRCWTYPHNISEEGVLFFITGWHTNIELDYTVIVTITLLLCKNRANISINGN